MGNKAAATQTALETSVPVKTFVTRNIFEQFDHMSEAIARRAFEIFNGNGRTPGHELENWLKAESELLHPVHMRMSESEDSITVEAEVPGFDVKDLDIRIENQRLVITGKRDTTGTEKKGKTVYEEQCSNKILRMISLPADVDADKAGATLKNGMLEVRMSKSPKALPGHVELKAA